jgi:hypothetical protein
MLYLGAMIGFVYFTTLFLQGVLGFSALQAGIAFFPMTVANVMVAMAIPRLTPRFGHAALLAAGMAVTLAGMAWFSRVQAASSWGAAVALPMVLIGASQGLAFAPLTAAGIAGVTAKEAGAASGSSTPHLSSAAPSGSASSSPSPHPAVRAWVTRRARWRTTSLKP